MARLDDLRVLRDDLVARMADCSSDQNFAVMGRLLLDVTKQLDELDPPDVKPGPDTPLSDFERRLNERTAKAAHRTPASRDVR